LQSLKEVVYEELPFVAGVNPQEVKSINFSRADARMRQKKNFIEGGVLDIFLNLSQPLQRILTLKIGLSREEVMLYLAGKC